MKKTVIGLLMVILMAGFSILLVGCASTTIKHLSGPEFIKQAKEMELISSFQWTSYIGKGASDRVYLEYGHPAFIGKGLKMTVYWTALSELPSELADQLRNGQCPWKKAAPGQKMALPGTGR
jgi:uncharacterized protein YxeA